LKKHDLFMRVFSLLRSKNCLLQFMQSLKHQRCFAQFFAWLRIAFA